MWECDNLADILNLLNLKESLFSTILKYFYNKSKWLNLNNIRNALLLLINNRRLMKIKEEDMSKNLEYLKQSMTPNSSMQYKKKMNPFCLNIWIRTIIHLNKTHIKRKILPKVLFLLSMRSHFWMSALGKSNLWWKY